MANFCANCGSKVEDYYNYCINCGAKIDKSDIKQQNPLNQHPYSREKKKAKQKLNRVLGGILSSDNAFRKTVNYNGLDYFKTRKAIRQQVEKEIDSGQIKSEGVECRVNQLIVEHKTIMENEKARIAKEKEEEKKKLKTIDEIFESEEIRSEIRNSSIDQKYINDIKNNLKNKIINEKENMTPKEIKHYIKKLIKAKKEMEKDRIAREEMNSEEIERNEITYGGYCSLNCRYCYEEFLDSSGSIVGDFADDGICEYYCALGHSVSYGSFCEDYE